jgi:predicted alpha/beta-fold hydrolase
MKEQIARNDSSRVDSPAGGSIRSAVDTLVRREPFIPHPALPNGHLQTIAGTLAKRRFSSEIQEPEARIFETAPNTRVLAHCNWLRNRCEYATLILLHGMEGSTDSRYMLGTAEKALRAGFNVVRLNMRNCGGTEHMTPTLYHAGLTDDLRSIIQELSEIDQLSEIYVAGFSLGGNVVLKLAGEYGANRPPVLQGVIGVSPSIDLAACASAIELKSNVLYSLRFVLSLRSRLRRKAELFPTRYDLSRLRGAWTIRQYDEAYVAPHWGFRDAADYYERASALRSAGGITVPSLIIHAKDDPFIPHTQFTGSEISANPNIAVVAPDSGGHVGFISAVGGESRFWAEKMTVEFVKLLSHGS